MRSSFLGVWLCLPHLLGVMNFKQDLEMIKLGVGKQQVLLEEMRTFPHHPLPGWYLMGEKLDHSKSSNIITLLTNVVLETLSHPPSNFSQLGFETLEECLMCAAQISSLDHLL